MERLENFVVCVKAALSQVCVRGWMFFQGEGVSLALVLCWICCERDDKAVLVWVTGSLQGVTEGWFRLGEAQAGGSWLCNYF